MTRLRPARPGEAALLSDLALRSKGHWGYDDGFLQRARPELTVTPEDVEGNAIRVAVDGDRLLGFSAVDVGSVRCV